jgi:hypothetical protein
MRNLEIRCNVDKLSDLRICKRVGECFPDFDYASP